MQLTTVARCGPLEREEQPKEARRRRTEAPKMRRAHVMCTSGNEASNKQRTTFIRIARARRLLVTPTFNMAKRKIPPPLHNRVSSVAEQER